MDWIYNYWRYNMRKLIQKLLLCLMVFTFVFSGFGAVASAASVYYKPGKVVNTSSGVNIHKNNFPSQATVITYTMSVNGNAIGTWDISKKTGWFSSYAQSTTNMVAPANLVKTSNNTVTVKACYRNGFDYKTYSCKSATKTGLTGKQVDNKTFKLNVDKSGKATLKY